MLLEVPIFEIGCPALRNFKYGRKVGPIIHLKTIDIVKVLDPSYDQNGARVD